MQFKVVGVMPDSPPNTHLKINMLVSYPTMISAFGERADNWNGNNTYTYVQLADNVQFEQFTSSLAKFSDRLIAEEKIESERVIGQKISDIHLYSQKTFEPENNNEALTVYFLLGVAFLVILSAFVNYINLATSKALDRAKEVGIRKVIGASTFSILYLLTKDFVKTVSIALLIGFPITYFLVSSWLSNFAIRIELEGHLFIFPAILVLVLVMLSLSWKTITTAMANPVDCLKEE